MGGVLGLASKIREMRVDAKSCLLRVEETKAPQVSSAYTAAQLPETRRKQ